MGKCGIVSMIFSCALSGFIIYKTLEFARKNQVVTYEEMLNQLLKNKFTVNTIHAIITLFLGICFIIMTAGFGAYFEQEFNLPSTVGCIVLCFFCFIVLKEQTKGIVIANEICTPILILSIIIVRLFIRAHPVYQAYNINCGKCIIDSILYASYNSITLIPLLIGLKENVKNKKNNMSVSVLCCLLLIVLGISIFTLMMIDKNNITSEIPMLVIIKREGSVFSYIYGIVILVAMYTSAISSGYSFIQNTPATLKNNIKILVLCVTAVLISKTGFKNLISILYPVFGYLGIIQMFFIFKA